MRVILMLWVFIALEN